MSSKAHCRRSWLSALSECPESMLEPQHVRSRSPSRSPSRNPMPDLSAATWYVLPAILLCFICCFSVVQPSPSSGAEPIQVSSKLLLWTGRLAQLRSKLSESFTQDEKTADSQMCKLIEALQNLEVLQMQFLCLGHVRDPSTRINKDLASCEAIIRELEEQLWETQCMRDLEQGVFTKR